MAPQTISLVGRTAVITGSTRGIGRAIAECFGCAGANVVLSSSQATAVSEAVATLTARGLRCSGLACDVSERKQVEQLLAHAVATWGGVDIWVNNAGRAGLFGATLDVPAHVWEQVIHVNLFGCYYGCMSVLPHMIERRYGKIVNVSGGGAHRAQRFLSAYSSSKAAIVRFTDALAREYTHLRYLSINVLEPGLVPTDMIMQHEGIGDARHALNAMPRVIRWFGTTAEETATLALRMVSHETDGVSGKTFSVMPRHRIFWRLFQGMTHMR